ncbi:3'-5' exonuclease [Shewanella sp. SM74]|uniref:3'-5' exonuclease n=1 Tax=Shewanella sp. SM74 TaxID=2912807 RepID=UPI0021D84F87|nr:3'-5' exonuclease [Shewanella sp. SM74]MCU8013657.1 3'-5' exonuclease [Shewanella sp. SM74]
MKQSDEAKNWAVNKPKFIGVDLGRVEAERTLIISKGKIMNDVEHLENIKSAGNISASVQAQSWLDNGAVILDTETTGLKWGSEIVEISIIDAVSGEVLLDTLVKPVGVIPDEVIAIHGITNEMVVDAPYFNEVSLRVADIIKDRPVVAYNAAFDRNMLGSALSNFSETDPLTHPLFKTMSSYQFHCAMLVYAQFKGDWNHGHGDFKSHSLVNAAKQQGITLEGTAHRALYDCQLTRELILKMAAE